MSVQYEYYLISKYLAAFISLGRIGAWTLTTEIHQNLSSLQGKE